jgi:polysaccharide chain length determinant protein (PEP-CTERM system associated)
MSVEFRQRTPGEYAQILWKHKWLIILPTIAITVAVAWVVWRLPNVYESTTLLIVKPSNMSKEVVPTLSDVDLSLRINNIGQVVVSRSSLEPMIYKYELYQQERNNKEPMELIIERMRKDIAVEVDKSRNDITNAFKISYRERDPRKTQLVTGELADKYVSAQIDAATNSASANKQFIEQQLKQKKDELDEVDRQRLQYMTEHVTTLPNTEASLIGQLAGLREQQKALISDIGRMRDQRTALSGQLSELQQQLEIDKTETIDFRTDIKASPAYGQLVQKKVGLESAIQNMLTTLKPANPDVKAAQAELDSTKRAMDEMVADAEAKNEEIRKRVQRRPDLRIAGIKSDIQRIENEINRQQQLLDQGGAQIEELQQRINSVPGSTVALEALNRDYQTKKGEYDDLLKKKASIDLSAEANITAQGESLQVIDPANLPTQPVAPKRILLMGMGLIVGLCVGLAFAALFEVPRLMTIQTSADAVHYTGLPVLISVPELLTPQEARRKPQRRLLLLFAGIIVTIFSIPALALALKITGILTRLAG